MRFDLTGAEWELMEPHVPVAAAGLFLRRVRDQFKTDFVEVSHQNGLA
ncbi:hypothetical protein [Lentzea sp. NPDC059081]